MAKASRSTVSRKAAERIPRGPRGERGPQGAPGPQGARGPKGDRGQRGQRGPRGAHGAQGMTGERGVRGHTGTPGPNAGPSDHTVQDLRQQLEAITQELKTQFQRIAQIQAQLDRSMPHEVASGDRKPLSETQNS